MFKFGVVMLFFLSVAQVIYGDVLRDPTRPPDAMDDKSGIRVRAVFISPHRKMLLINDRYFTIGDEVAGGKIIDIQSDTIYLQGKSGKFTIPVSQEMKQPAAGARGGNR